MRHAMDDLFILLTSSSVRKPEEQLHRPFRYSAHAFLLSALAISGAYSPERERKRSSFVFNIICFSGLTLFTIRHALLVGAHVSTDRSWFAFLELLFSINAFTAVLLLLRKQSLLHRCLQQSLTTDAQQNKAPEQLSRRLCIGAILYVCVEVGLDVCGLLTVNGHKHFFDFYFPRGKLGSRKGIVPLLLATTDILFRKVLVLLPAQLAVSLFVVLVVAMRDQFARFNRFFDSIAANKRQLSASALRLLRATRCDLHDTLLEFDTLFSPIVLVWFANFVFCVAIQAMALLTDSPVLSHRLLLGVRLLFLFFWFVMFTSVAVSLADEANEALFSFQRALVEQTSLEPRFFAQSQALLKQLARPELWLTGWRYFNVDKSAILSAISAIFTYFVLILEFNPSVKEAIQSFAQK